MEDCIKNVNRLTVLCRVVEICQKAKMFCFIRTQHKRKHTHPASERHTISGYFDLRSVQSHRIEVDDLSFAQMWGFRFFCKMFLIRERRETKRTKITSVD